MTSRVSCSHTPFHLPILFYSGPEGAWACVRCGQVTYSQIVGDDGRGGGEAWTDIIEPEVLADVKEWVGQFPRFHEPSGAYVPASARIRDEDDLANLPPRPPGESLTDTLRRAGIPDAPPPEGLPLALQFFGKIWTTLQLPEDASLEDLCEHALQSPFQRTLLQDRIRAQPGIEDWLCAAIRAVPDDLYWYTQNAGKPFFLAMDLLEEGGAPEKVRQTLVEYLTTMPVSKNPYWHDELQHAFRLDAALRVVQTWPPDMTLIRMLSDLKKRIGPSFKSYQRVDNAIHFLQDKMKK